MELNRAELETVLRDQFGNIGYGNDVTTIADVVEWLQDEGYTTRWICLVDDEFSCNGYLAGGIVDKAPHAVCGEFLLVKINESPVTEASNGG